jgi:hypothetical protein
MSQDWGDELGRRKRQRPKGTTASSFGRSQLCKSLSGIKVGRNHLESFPPILSENISRSGHFNLSKANSFGDAYNQRI